MRPTVHRCQLRARQLLASHHAPPIGEPWPAQPPLSTANEAVIASAVTSQPSHTDLRACGLSEISRNGGSRQTLEYPAGVVSKARGPVSRDIGPLVFHTV